MAQISKIIFRSRLYVGLLERKTSERRLLKQLSKTRFIVKHAQNGIQMRTGGLFSPHSLQWVV